MSRTVKFNTKDGAKQFDVGVQRKMQKEQVKAVVDQTAVASHADVTEEEKKDFEKPFAPSMDEQFAGDYNEYDDRDQRMQMKLQLQEGLPVGRTPLGDLKATESDFAWLEKKRARAEQANLHAWFARNYDRASPEQKAVARQLFPEFYAMRATVLKKNIKLLKRIAEVKLHGPRNRKDVLLLYAIASGYIPADPCEDVLHPERQIKFHTEALRQASFRRGLLNPRANDIRFGTANGNTRTIDGKVVQERTYNAGKLLGMDMENYPGRPDLSGTVADDGTTHGFHVQYRQLLKDMGWKAPGANRGGGVGGGGGGGGGDEDDEPAPAVQSQSEPQPRQFVSQDGGMPGFGAPFGAPAAAAQARAESNPNNRKGRRAAARQGK